MLASRREQVDIALEWIELRDIVISDLGKAMAKCEATVTDLDTFRMLKEPEKFLSVDNVNIDGLVASLNQSPASTGCGKLVCITANDKAQNESLQGLMRRLEPLRISLDFLDIRTADLKNRLLQHFPDAARELESQLEDLHETWEKLSSDANLLTRKLGEDRWLVMLLTASQRANKLMAEVDDKLGDLIDITSGGPLSLPERITAYETIARHNVPEIVKITALLSRAATDHVISSEQVFRNSSLLQNTWSELEDRLGEVDQKYGLDIVRIARGDAKESRARSRASRASSRTSTIELNFRASRDRSRSTASATSIVEPASPKSPLYDDDDDDMRTPNAERKGHLYMTPKPAEARSSTSNSNYSVGRGGETPSAIPVRKRQVIAHADGKSTVPRPNTPAEVKRKVSGIPLPKSALPPLPTVPSTTTATPAVLRHKASTPSLATSSLAKRTSNMDLRNDISSTVSKATRQSLAPPTTPATRHTLSKQQSTLNLSRATPTLSSSNRAASTISSSTRASVVSAKGLFTPVQSNTLNHHASTPNLSAARSKAVRASNVATISAANAVANAETTTAVASQAHQQQQKPLKTPAPAYKVLTSNRSPSGMQKFYIKYGKGLGSDAGRVGAVAGEARGENGVKAESTGGSARVLTTRKSIATIKEKPRWR
ncbi:karyogamy protein [Limtongia smithiae]|uniref:karyogamy protein n=1 Tax=Limtongia smithiae TaxID=1125753 RepID=UPI0034CF1665